MNRRDFVTGIVSLALSGCTRRDVVTVGTKNFTEQLILGEIMAQSIERASLSPERRFYLAGSYICHQALLAGRLDTYVEYTGTALTAILKQPPTSDRDAVLRHVTEMYRDRFSLLVMPALGFNNSFAIALRGDDARRLGLTKLSQLGEHASRFRMGVGFEFLERPDGFTGLAKAYGLNFAEAPRVMDLGLLYRALQSRQVDVIAGSNTDGLIAALGLVVLEDDRRYFPPYDAVPIARPAALDAYPNLRGIFDHLAGRISAEQMRRMNYAVDGEKRDAAAVAREFLSTVNPV